MARVWDDQVLNLGVFILEPCAPATGHYPKLG